MDIKIIVATHKPYRMPEDSMYIPLHAGREGKESMGYIGDNTGDHISDKNAYFNEATATYWAWRNLNADAYGIAHYRRHFTVRNVLMYKLAGKWNSILTKPQAEELLRQYDILLPNKRRYWIETNEQHYLHSSWTRQKELALIRKIIKVNAPAYASALETVMKRRWAHMFDMYIMRKAVFDDYCRWLFPILFAFEAAVDTSGYPEKDKRLFINELMIDTWLEVNKAQYSYKEIYVMYMERQNWITKGGGMVLRKIKGHLNHGKRAGSAYEK